MNATRWKMHSGQGSSPPTFSVYRAKPSSATHAAKPDRNCARKVQRNGLAVIVGVSGGGVRWKAYRRVGSARTGAGNKNPGARPGLLVLPGAWLTRRRP